MILASSRPSGAEGRTCLGSTAPSGLTANPGRSTTASTSSVYRRPRLSDQKRRRGRDPGCKSVDYEGLAAAEIDNYTKRLESAFKFFDEKCGVYQYLFKRNYAELPYQTYPNPIVNAAIENRIAYLRSKAESLYSLKIYYVIMFEGFRYKKTLFTGIANVAARPGNALAELRALLSTKDQVVLIETEIEKARLTLLAKARSFVTSVSHGHSPFRLPPRIPSASTSLPIAAWSVSGPQS